MSMMQQNEMTMGGDLEIRHSPLEDDIVAHRFIQNQKTLQFETDLFASKWFDYRHLTPLAATRLYIQAYDGVYRRHYAVNMDHNAAKYVRTISIDEIFGGLDAPESSTHKKAKSHFTACWHGRQMADMLGMPYEVYLDLAFEYRLRYWNRPYLPQPQHLYSDMVVDRVQQRWPELQAARLYTSDHPAYLIENYQNLPQQNDYHEWLFKQAGLRANPGEMLGRFVNEDLLPVEKIKGRVEEGVFEIARTYMH
ncbi:hypothetical protein [Shinella zoogloeoides]|uniref:hypothetical protein n=1 Tax=Shinella zoogloeoides TaxID=352475 RepID=UPI00273F6D55|nr:hypothetical protein [Shinella zoogloeoides]WLR91025.1 hypothetical protein Q9316_00320 [Shinella zoogloeoides]